MAPSWTDVGQTIAAIIGTGISLFGFVFVIFQLQQNRQSIDNQTYAIIYQLSRETYGLMVENPEIRPYFYDNKPLPLDELERSKVLAAAELLCDIFEYLILNQNSMKKSIRDGWLVYMKHMYCESQCLREFLTVREKQFSQEFLLKIGHYHKK